MNPIRIAFAEDHVILRKATITLLSLKGNFEVVLEAGNGLELLNGLKSTEVDVIILDIQMPILGGFDTLIELRKTEPDIKVIMFSTLNDIFTIRELAKIGINSFVSKSNSEILADTIVEVHKNGVSYNADFTSEFT